MLDAWGEAEVLKLVERFFATFDPVVGKCDFTVKDLYRLAHHLQLLPLRPSISPQMRANLAAGARACGYDEWHIVNARTA